MRKSFKSIILWLFLVVIIASCGGGSGSPNGGDSPDTIAPSDPTGLLVSAVTSSVVSLNWNASTDNIGVSGYKIFRNSTQISTTTSTAFNDSGLISSTTYTYTISAYDAVGNNSAQSTPLGATTSSSEPFDTQAPTSPANPTATAVGPRQVTLTWSSSQDNVGVVGYIIYRDGVYLKSVATTTTNDTDLSESTAYCYSLAAFDAANNTSGQSAQVCATTTANVGTGEVTGRIFWNTVPVSSAGALIKTGSNYYSSTTVAETVTDASGAFDLRDVPAGDYYIYGVKPQGSTEYWDWFGQPVTVWANELVDVGTLHLSKIMTLIEPQNNEIVTTNPPTFSWQAFPGADNYHLDVFENGGSYPRLISIWTATTSYIPPQALPSGREYQWSVHAYTADGWQIAYYSAWIFAIP
jgi:chitodextrinase